MVGVVTIAHSFIGKELIATAEYIVGKMDGIFAVSIDCQMSALEARSIISEAIKKVDQGEGVLILTDLFGGSPSNIAFSFLSREKVEVITGVNLPMILTFWNKSKGMGLMELAKTLQLSGRRSIAVSRNLKEAKSLFGRIPKGGVDGERPLKSPPDSASAVADLFNSESSGSAIRLKAFQVKNPAEEKFNTDKGKTLRGKRVGNSRSLKKDS